MTVEEMIEKLKSLDPNARIVGADNPMVSVCVILQESGDVLIASDEA